MTKQRAERYHLGNRLQHGLRSPPKVMSAKPRRQRSPIPPPVASALQQRS